MLGPRQREYLISQTFNKGLCKLQCVIKARGQEEKESKDYCSQDRVSQLLALGIWLPF